MFGYFVNLLVSLDLTGRLSSCSTLGHSPTVDTSPGAELATLLLSGFTTMVEQVIAELDRRGHPGVTASHEFALQAIDAGAQNAAELSRALDVSRQAAAQTINALEQMGYLERQTDPSDGRRKQLVVTARGYDMVHIGSAAFDGIRLRWSAELGADNVEILESGLRALVAAETMPPDRLPPTSKIEPARLRANAPTHTTKPEPGLRVTPTPNSIGVGRVVATRRRDADR